ncbi:oligopeptide ABC transporter permease [Cellulosilyticum lentocellum]|uniref:ABC-type transporter, integral membrane subunit n=1 Tax=Cellulosilyticum lentocellum (strain ATCC 49066 / DSM 5427 / NCIMB 11756 / RHM5) TaxID=642492 RepID=F2JHC9_CELLD|nr:oligopeptide ABC transporter permease [Cellulosilyticum lentocellum]ADZ83027.1 ABC-type transporter, integral membrane subunit [Cellulosilyticum lentocellum DSM 5427]
MKRLISQTKVLAQRVFGKNKLALVGFSILMLFIMLAAVAPVIAPYERDAIDLGMIEVAPSREHLLGTDELGRDVLTRLLYGGRVSLGVSLMATVLQLVIGVTLGAIAGYFGGLVDNMIMRLVDIMMCFPFFVIAISMAAIMEPGVVSLVIIIGILQWTNIARIVRVEILSLKQREFIEASRVLGLNSFEIIKKHLLPNVLAPLIVYTTLAIANGILLEAGLSFLGMGVRQPQPSWGNMLTAAQSMRVLKSQWWLWIPPGLLVFLTVLSINFLGDGLRDGLDPKLKRR